MFFAGLVLVAATAALLNLDTAVVFLTPVMIAAARRRGLDEQPFLYGTRLGGGRLQETITARPGVLGVSATFGVVVLLLVTRNPALPVLALGIAAASVLAVRGRLDRHDLLKAVNPVALAAVFCVAVALGTLARAWGGPAELMSDVGRVPTAVIGAVAAVLVNNLPAAALLSAEKVHHGRALLIGLNVGPNLAVTGALSAFLWLQAARTAGARPSVLRFSKLGLVVAPAGIAGALLALYVFAPSRV